MTTWGRWEPNKLTGQLDYGSARHSWTLDRFFLLLGWHGAWCLLFLASFPASFEKFQTGLGTSPSVVVSLGHPVGILCSIDSYILTMAQICKVTIPPPSLHAHTPTHIQSDGGGWLKEAPPIIRNLITTADVLDISIIVTPQSSTIACTGG